MQWFIVLRCVSFVSSYICTSNNDCRYSECTTHACSIDLVKCQYPYKNCMITNCEGQRFWCPSPPCPAPGGQYCSGGTFDNFIISVCPAGFYCYSNYYEYPDNKTPCPSGYTSPAGSSSRSACYTDCKAPAGSYCPSLSGIPIVCPPNTTSPAGSTSETACCPIGYDCTSGPPYPCKSGYWRKDGVCAPCQICSPGYLTIQTCIDEINAECTQCLAGTYCPTTSTSITCPYHEYCPRGVAASIPCPTEMQSKLGSINITNCTSSKLGWYLNEASIILPCPVNYYKNTEDFSPCTQCQQGWFALDEGASTCMQCSQGMYPNISAGICQACKNTCSSSNETSIHCMGKGTTVCCGSDTYFIDGVSTKCMPCDQGSYSLDGAGSSCILCPVNSKKSNSSGTVCECDLTQGLYMHNITPNTCIPCPENFYCIAQQLLIKCPPGTNRPLGQLPINKCSNCTNPPIYGEYAWVDTGVCEFQCKAGYYMDIWGDDTFCNECTQNFTCNPGQTAPNCIPTCSLGWYVPLCTQGSSSDNQCQQCPPIPNAIRTSLCDFSCPKVYFYNAASKLCSKCSNPTCNPGQYATNCSKEADSVCLACNNGPWNGPFAWNTANNQSCVFQCSGAAYYNQTNNRTCQECEAGTYKASPTSCSKCTATQCVAGTNRTQCGKGEVADSVCSQCSNTPTDGLFTWITACNFTCANAYYLNGTACAPCSNPSCTPGEYATTCTRLVNSVCVVCTNQPTSGSITYNSGCNFTCNSNAHFNATSDSCAVCPRYYYRSTPTACSRCTTGQCSPGMNRTQCNAGTIEDAPCIPCSNSPTSREFNWTAGCAFTCKYGLYYNSTLNACLNCQMPQCPYAGQYASPCTDSGYSECTDCVGPQAGTYDWTSGCNFTCSGASNYFNAANNKCIQCTKPACPPGKKAGQCTDQISSPACEACTNHPSTGPFIWANECNFTCTNYTYNNNGKCLPCNTGTFLSSLNGCSPCNSTLCSPGLYRTLCPTGSVSDAPCSKCKTQVTGPFAWTSQCASICVNQTYLLNGTNCTPCKEPCPNGTFASRLCTSTEDTKCAPCDVIPQPPNTFSWTGGCNSQCITGFVWNKSHCLDVTVTDMVTIQSSTNMEFNNTVEEVCANLDLLVYAVTSSMEELYGIPFTGNVTSVNNQTVDAACSGDLTIKIGRRLTNAKAGGGSRSSVNKTVATVDAASQTSTTKSGTQTNNEETYVKITEKLTTGNKNGNLSPDKVNTNTDTTDVSRSDSSPDKFNTDVPHSDSTPKQQQQTISASVLVAIISGSVVAVALIYCVCRSMNKKQRSLADNVNQKQSQFKPPIQSPHYTLLSMPRIHPPKKDP